ncbi:hypothetical protein KCU99_g9714, partial [Aureobasidium melanogenum]
MIWTDLVSAPAQPLPFTVTSAGWTFQIARRAYEYERPQGVNGALEMFNAAVLRHGHELSNTLTVVNTPWNQAHVVAVLSRTLAGQCDPSVTIAGRSAQLVTAPNKNIKIHKAIIEARANCHILITGTPMSKKLHNFEGMIRLFWRPKTGGLDEPFHPLPKAFILSIIWLRFHVRPGSFHTIDATYIPCFEHLNMPDNLQSGDALVGVPAPAPVHEQGFVLFFSICHMEAGSFNAVKHEFHDDFEIPRRDLNLRGSLFSVVPLSPFTDGKREFVACRPREVTFIGWLRHLLMHPGPQGYPELHENRHVVDVEADSADADRLLDPDQSQLYHDIMDSMDKVFAGKDFQFLSQVDGGAGSAKTFVCQLIIDHANQLAQTKNQPTTGSELRVSREQGALTKLQPRTRSSAEASASTSIYRPGEASMEALVMWTESRQMVSKHHQRVNKYSGEHGIFIHFAHQLACCMKHHQRVVRSTPDDPVTTTEFSGKVLDCHTDLMLSLFDYLGIGLDERCTGAYLISPLAGPYRLYVARLATTNEDDYTISVCQTHAMLAKLQEAL